MDPKIVVIKTITNTHPYMIPLFAVYMVMHKANAITPLIRPEYHIMKSSYVFNLNCLFIRK